MSRWLHLHNWKAYLLSYLQVISVFQLAKSMTLRDSNIGGTLRSSFDKCTRKIKEQHIIGWSLCVIFLKQLISWLCSNKTSKFSRNNFANFFLVRNIFLLWGEDFLCCENCFLIVKTFFLWWEFFSYCENFLFEKRIFFFL